MDNKIDVTGTLENWMYDPRGVYWGNIYNDDKGRFVDGDWIHTSLAPAGHKEGDVVTTLNSSYLLGKPFDFLVIPF